MDENPIITINKLPLVACMLNEVADVRKASIMNYLIFDFIEPECTEDRHLASHVNILQVVQIRPSLRL